MNKMKEVAHLLGVKLGEKFKITGYEGQLFYFTDDGLICIADCDTYKYYYQPLVDLLLGEEKIERIPFKPQHGDFYWYLAHDDVTRVKSWVDDAIDYALYNVGNCFRYSEEAEKKR